VRGLKELNMRRICYTLIFLLTVSSFQMIPAVTTVANASANEIATSSDGTEASACNQVVGTPNNVSVVRIGSDCIVTFTGNSTWTAPSGISSMRYLIVAGGGAGGAAGGNDGSGGGGAGGLLAGNFVPTPTNYTVSVGSGGASYALSAANHDPRNFNGGNSSISGSGLTTITAIGGGSGSSESNILRTASNGGSGGGGGGHSGARGTASPTGQGNDGGFSASPGDGGGGGAGARGGNGNSSSTDGTPRRTGGIGVLSDISGMNKYYAGGGGASGDARNADGVSGGAGGLGGGGNGASASNNSSPTNGAPNTGGGGGGAAGVNPVGSVKASGAGGSGIAIFRYTVNTNCSPTSNTSSQPGYVILTFISVGSCTWNRPEGITSADVLVVGGGGGGGRAANGSILLGNEAGGGGAGGFTESLGVSLNQLSYSITVGAGGDPNVNGTGSSAVGISVSGGGRGAYAIHTFTSSAGSGNRGAGGASGGGGMHDRTAGGTGIDGQGFAGGSPTSGSQGGGGGGAGEAGNTDGAGHGGDGKVSQINGVTYAGGGSGTNPGVAGDGGGGVAAGFSTLPVGGTNNGASNTGSGGAGGFTNDGTANAGAGGSGIVIIRYLTVSTINSLNDSALTLNGSSQFASTPDNSSLDISGNLTLAAWVNPRTTSGTMTVAGKAGAYLLRTNNGIWEYCLQGATLSCISTAIPVVALAWQHVAFTRNASTVNFYLNGISVFSTGGSGSVGSGSINNSSSEFQVGRQLTQDYFNGSIDEVRLWSAVRSQSQIQSDMRTWGPVNASGLVAYYDFNELSSSIVLNRSGTNPNILNLVTSSSPIISVIETTTVSQAYTIVTFPRTYLVASGGWRAPNSVSNIQLLIVGGGGGAGFGYCGGGGGAGRVLLSNSRINVVSGNSINVIVGTGGIGGFRSSSINIVGQRGETSSVTVATQTYSASGGGGGGGGNGVDGNAAPGTVGGSGGGGTACGQLTAGGAADNSNVSGFLSYANAGASGTANVGGGGGGGAGEAGNTDGAGHGGDGINIWGFELAGGGGGWPNGSGGTGGGGTALDQFDTKVRSGFPGTPNTGSGGGGGNDGGSGRVSIRYITNTPTILTQPLSDTTTVGTVDTFTITTSVAPTPLTKSVQWQFTSDTTTAVVANITGWTNLSILTGTGFTTDTFTTVAVTKALNKFRYRAIVTFADSEGLSVQETSTVAVLTVNDAITFSDTSTITRKYGDTQTVRTISYVGGTTNTGGVGTAISHTVRGQVGSQASGRIVLDTSTPTAVFRVDTRTVVGSYVETITVTDARGATATYTQRVVVTQADTLTVQADTLTAITFGGTLSPTATVTGLVPGDAVSSTTIGHISCANGGRCAVGDIGPGGGVVFFEITNSSDSQTAIAGYTSGGIYLEAAPVGWGNNIPVAAGETTGTSYLDPVVNWCNTATDINNRQVGIGQGANNTRLGDIGCTSGAVQIAADWTSPNGLNDWYLPSQNELEQMGLQKNLIGLIYGLTNCFGTTCYWSSTEVSGSSSRALQVNVGSNVMGSNDKLLNASNQVMMRPIRAFSPRAIGQETVTAGAPTAAGTYTLRPTAITLAEGVNTNNYVFVDYRSSSVTINRATQSPRISMQPASVAYDTGTVTQALTATSGPGTGAVFYLIGAGSAATCSISGSTVRISADGVCNVVAYKQASTNYLADSATAVAITFTRFIPRPIQVQLYPSMIPLNQGNALEKSALPQALLTITNVATTSSSSYTVAGTGFNAISIIRIGAETLAAGTNYTYTPTSISINNAAGMAGPLLIELSDGQQAVFFTFPNNP
jgi:hypothetical protein